MSACVSQSVSRHPHGVNDSLTYQSSPFLASYSVTGSAGALTWQVSCTLGHPTSRKDAPGMVKNMFFLDLNLLLFEVKKLKQNKKFSFICLKDVGIKFEKNILYVLRVKKFRE